MDLGIKDQVVAVAGGSYGIGFGAAIQLVQEGAKVAILARNEEKLKEAAQSIQDETGYYPFLYTGDITNKEQCQEFIQETVNYYGKLDGLVIAAGASQKGMIENVDEDDWNRSWDLNVMSCFYLVQESLTHLKKSLNPKIVVVGSASAKQPSENQLISNVTKAGTLTFVKTLAEELAPFNICINNVCPGKILSERRQNRMLHEAKEKNIPVEEHVSHLAETIPLSRLGTTEEVASMIVYLLSEQASYISGQSINVDGGLIKSII
ncbi:SDR family NAD(P)-dependent oxidoreductase [Alteribacter populi]|uniref:SDR family NAD(P)-dependent oxidoreductase n=1 Tax=Alteribacter populi TaxID=2011011 RepID=UPI0012FD148B|nr:SDR family oxidoreductase [Alteribacter populi]